MHLAGTESASGLWSQRELPFASGYTPRALLISGIVVDTTDRISMVRDVFRSIVKVHVWHNDGVSGANHAAIPIKRW